MREQKSPSGGAAIPRRGDAATPSDRLPPREQDRSLRPVEDRHPVPGRCPACSASGLQEMTFRLKNGEIAQLRQCSRCQWKSWYRNGERTALADVLAAVQQEGLPYGRR